MAVQKTKVMISCVNEMCAVGPHCTGNTEAVATVKWNRRARAAQEPDGWVSVPMPSGMPEPLRKIGSRLRMQLADRFSISRPIQFTDNERQTLLAALDVLASALAFYPPTERKGDSDGNISVCATWEAMLAAAKEGKE